MLHTARRSSFLSALVDMSRGLTKAVMVPALKDLKHDIGNMLNNAIAAIGEENDALAGVLKNNIDFNEIKGNTKIADSKWKDLLDHFNHPKFVLVNETLEFPDLLGAAYEYLIKYFADSAGKKGGAFYTPAEVVRLMVQLTKPGAGNEIYDRRVGRSRHAHRAKKTKECVTPFHFLPYGARHAPD